MLAPTRTARTVAIIARSTINKQYVYNLESLNPAELCPLPNWDSDCIIDITIP